MYKKANKDLWQGRVDSEDKELGYRWHQKVKILSYPYKKDKGIALLGFDCDEGVKRNKGRVGSAKSCDVLKKGMGNFAYHLENTKLYDAGKIVAGEDLESAQEHLASHVTKLLKQKHFPIVLGGGHEIAYASFLGLFNSLKSKDNIAIINFDAHFDLRFNKVATSGTPFSQISILCQEHNVDFNYMCLGVSKAANTRALFAKAKELNVKHILDTKMTYIHLEKILYKIDKFLTKKDYIYLTIDTDVFTASSVPAVSAPAARGIELNITHDILEYLFSKYKKKIKLIDFAEFNPQYDIANIGQKAINRLIFDIVSLVDRNISS